MKLCILCGKEANCSTLIFVGKPRFVELCADCFKDPARREKLLKKLTSVT